MFFPLLFFFFFRLFPECSQVPADVRLLEAMHLEIDESVLTGEAVPCNKSLEPIKEGGTPEEIRAVAVGDRHNMAFRQTSIVSKQKKASKRASERGKKWGK